MDESTDGPLSGCDTFTEIEQADGISRVLFARLLMGLERQVLINRVTGPDGRDARYVPTAACEGLWNVLVGIGQ